MPYSVCCVSLFRVVMSCEVHSEVLGGLKVGRSEPMRSMDSNREPPPFNGHLSFALRSEPLKPMAANGSRGQQSGFSGSRPPVV